MARTIPELFLENAERHGQTRAIYDPHAQPALEQKYAELAQDVRAFAAGLQHLGISHGDRVALISDNDPRWILTDLALLSFGAVNVPRGSDSAVSEIHYILDHSEASAAVIADRRLFEKLFQDNPIEPPLRILILMDDSADGLEAPAGVRLENFSRIIQLGQEHGDQNTEASDGVQPSDLATIIYTSGTTGSPKGVMLTHANLMHQAQNIDPGIEMRPGDLQIAILPAWHVYERAAEFFAIRNCSTLAYSSKRHLRDDMGKLRPHFLPCVPRMWESIYDGIMDKLRKEPQRKQKLVNFFLSCSHKYIRARRTSMGLDVRPTAPSAAERLRARMVQFGYSPIHGLADKIVYAKIREVTGGKLKAAVSGGGSLAPYLDDFFEVVGLPVLNGYGLSETAPVLTVRTVGHNVRGTVGCPIAGVEISIRDENGRELPQGQTGIIWARSPGLMLGYYKNPEQTQSVRDDKGWFNTGDLGWRTYQGDLVIAGRAKDTIVLSSGENIEPEPLEECAKQSPLISQIIVVGQDQKSLGALVVPNAPELADAVGLTKDAEPEKIVEHPRAVKVVRESINALTCKDFRTYEQISKIIFILEPFSEANGLLTQTLKPKRGAILKKYEDLIKSAYA